MKQLESLGWRSFFAAQVDPDSPYVPARVMAVHRGRVEVVGEDFCGFPVLSGNSAAFRLTVGDWVLVDREGPRLERLIAQAAASSGKRLPERAARFSPRSISFSRSRT